MYMDKSKSLSPVIKIINECIKSGDSKELSTLCSYADQCPNLTRSVALSAWNSMDAKTLKYMELKELFIFFSQRHDIGSVADYFSEEMESEETPFTDSLKEEYIATLAPISTPAVVKNARYVLDHVRTKMESIIGKNVLDFDRNDMIAGLSNLKLTTTKSIQKTYSIIKGYVTWASKKRICPAMEILDSITSADIPIARGTSEKIIPTPESLLEIIEEIKKPGWFNTDSAAVILVWCGLSLEEALSLKNEDVDIINGLIHFNGKTIEIPPVLKKVISDYALNDEVESGVAGGGTHLEADDIGYFLKKFLLPGRKANRGEPIKLKRLRDMLHEFAVEYSESTGVDRKINERVLRESGALWRLWKKETDGYIITKEDVQKEFPQKNNQSITDFLRLYAQYKKNFTNVD